MNDVGLKNRVGNNSRRACNAVNCGRHGASPGGGRARNAIGRARHGVFPDRGRTVDNVGLKDVGGDNGRRSCNADG